MELCHPLGLFDFYSHLDMDYFYVQTILLRKPHLRGKPVVAGGDASERHGIILAKSPEAKRAGIQTGNSLFEAKQLCPNLIIEPVDFLLVKRLSARFKAILLEYTDYVESFGIDEAWIKLVCPSIEEATHTVNNIRRRIYNEIGLTVSAGVSFNKFFSKLGSDVNKPNGICTISRENYQQLVWPLSTRDLLFVGAKTHEKLARLGVRTIGDLAHASEDMLLDRLGVLGLQHKMNAMGLDQSPIKPFDLEIAPKSVGNSSTAPHDIETMEHAKCLIYILADSVAARLRAGGYRARCISISARDTDLKTTSCQRTIKIPTSLSGEIAKGALSLFEQRYGRGFPFRSMGISCSSLVEDTQPQQLDLFQDNERRESELALERTIDDLRGRYWSKVVQRGIMAYDPDFARVNPIAHDIHPVPIYTG